MNTRQFVITCSLGLTLAFSIIWMLSSSFNQAQANTDIIVTPTPKISRVEVTQSRQDVPIKEHITDSQSKTNYENLPLSPSSAHIANGDFENGQDGSWQEYSAHGWDIIVDTSTLPTTPHSGSFAAWLGGDYDDVSYISQAVTMPTGASTLRYWYWIASGDVCGYDFGWVKINTTNLQVIDLCEDNNTNGWVEKIIDVSAYAGQTVTLQIRVETDVSLNSNLFFDDVKLDVGFNTYLPINYNNYWVGYFDDFSDPNSGWPIGENEDWKYGYLNGEYQFYLKAESGSFWMTPGPITGRALYLPDDYRVELDIHKVSGGECWYGLMFGIQYATNALEAYMILVNPTSGEFYLDKNRMDGTWTVLVDWTYSSAINQGGGTNHIAVERVGSTIKLIINGVQVANVTDSSFLGPGRDAGFVALKFDNPAVDVRIDNFTASQQ